MKPAKKSVFVNSLIERLPRKERERLLGSCEPVELRFGDLLCETNHPLRYAYFPLVGFISLVFPTKGHRPLEMALIGNEGMLGAKLALGMRLAPLSGIVQGSGSALRISASNLGKQLLESPVLLSILHRYLYILIKQLSQNNACNRFHEVAPRLARWLLTTQDRALSDEFHLTQQFLADMLGVRRSAVSIAATALQKKRFISYSRGDIRILSRKGLQASACSCYSALLSDYDQILG